MKKTISLILALVLMCTTLFSLTACGGSNGDVDALNAKIVELTEQLNAANSKISALEAEKAAQAAEITTLNAEIKVLEAEKATLAANKTTLEAEKALLEEKITDLETEIARLQALMDGNSNALLEEIAEFEEQVKSLKAQIASLQSEKANLESQITSLNAQIGSLNAEKEALTARIGELEASIAAKNTEIGTLNSTITALSTEKNTLIAEKNDLLAENGELKEENEELKALVAALRNCLNDKHIFVDGTCLTCAKEDEVYTCDGDYIYFGEYPQTLKAEDISITDTQDYRGYYLGNDGNYYAKVVAKKCDVLSRSYFTNGALVNVGEVYYFKVEPIKWRIVNIEGGAALIICDSILLSMSYQSDCTEMEDNYFTSNNGAPAGTYANNYKYSDLRAWLNGEFYQTAFNSVQRDSIPSSFVMNNAESTTIANNPYADADNEYTYDKVFAPSRSDITNENYGFASDEDRMIITSDYAIACGAYSFAETGMGAWWSRSPCSCSSIFILGSSNTGYVGTDETPNHGYATLDYIGIVPALRIEL